MFRFIIVTLLSLVSVTAYGQLPVSSMTEETTPASADLLYLIKTPGGAGTSRKATVSNLTKGLAPASATVQGVVTTGAQTFAGVKTFNGTILLPSGLAVSPGLAFTDSTGTGIVQGIAGNGSLTFSSNGIAALFIANTGNNFVSLPATSAFVWSSGGAGTAASDILLSRDASGVLLLSLDSGVGGRLLIGPPSATSGAQIHTIASTAATVGQIIQLAATPTANAFEVNSSAGSGGDLAKINAAGGLVVGTATVTNIDTGNGAVELAAGGYTPTLTNQTNATASTAYACQYMRVGQVVTVSGKVDVDPTAPGQVQVGISLPIASLVSAEEKVAGSSAAKGIAGQSAAILGDATNDRATLEWIAVDLTNQAMYFEFTYTIE